MKKTLPSCADAPLFAVPMGSMSLMTLSALSALITQIALLFTSSATAQPSTGAAPQTQTQTQAPQRPPRPAAVRAQPHDVSAPVPPVVHRSALRPMAPDAVPVGSWSDANRVVDEAGGWKAYLREAHGQPPAVEKAK